MGNPKPTSQMLVEEDAKLNPAETNTNTFPLYNDGRHISAGNNIDDAIITEDIHQQLNANVAVDVSKDVKLHTHEEEEEEDPQHQNHVDDSEHTEMHPHNYSDHDDVKEEQVKFIPSIDVTHQSNDFEDVNNQQQCPAEIGLLQTTAADANLEDASTDGDGLHVKIETGGSSANYLHQLNSVTPTDRTTETSPNDNNNNNNNIGEGDKLNDGDSGTDAYSDEESKLQLTPKLDVGSLTNTKSSNQSFLLEPHAAEGDESGTEEEQSSFMKELETFFKERSMDFRPPKFYGEGLNLLKLWRAVTRLGGYEKATSCKLWRQVGESFKPPKTCTTVSWTFRNFYEKALLEYEKHEMHGGELSIPDASLTAPNSVGNQAVGSQGSGRARRDAAARAMQGWHSQRLLGNGEVGDPVIKDKNSISMLKRERQLESIGLLKRKSPSPVERAVKVSHMKATKPQEDIMVIDAGPPADWVKINVRRTKDCFEVYALIPGLLREEVRVQSDPVGRLVISGEPEELDNPWGVTPFKKVVSLPSRIDPHQTSAVVTLHGQLFVRVPFEQSNL